MTLRAIHINKDVWRYAVGKSNIVIRFPNGKRAATVSKDQFLFDTAPSNATMTDVQDWTGEGNPNFQEDYIISPKKIKEFIIRNLI